MSIRLAAETHAHFMHAFDQRSAVMRGYFVSKIIFSHLVLNLRRNISTHQIRHNVYLFL